MRKTRNITLSELAEKIMSLDSETKSKQVESIGLNSRNQFYISFTDKTEVTISQTVK